MAGLSRADAINLYGTEAYTAWDPTAAHNDFVAKGSNKGNQTAASDQAQTAFNQASTNYQTAIQPAINTLNTANTTAGSVYNQGTTNNQAAYNDTINAVTIGAQRENNVSLAARNIDPNSTYGVDQLNQILFPQEQQAGNTLTNANQAVNSQYGNTLNTNYGQQASLQGGRAFDVQNLATQAPQLAANVGLAQAQTGLAQAQQPGANYISSPYGVIDARTGQLIPNSGVGAANTNNNSGQTPNGATYTQNGVTHTYVNGQWGVTS